jgi:CubicO group peptidase (beta-lactamase class C family)
MKNLRAVLITFALAGSHGPAADAVWPGSEWLERKPAAVGMSAEKLTRFAEMVGGRGCVVRHGTLVFQWGDPAKSGDVASAFKPLLSTLLMMAVQEGKPGSVDEPVAAFEPRLKSLNGGKDAGITWRHLASQTSGYGLAEKPGAAYAYNDYALTFYYDTLMEKVFRTNGTEVLRSRFAEPLQFQDSFTFNAFGPTDRPGRLALSCRDFARFGLLILRHGKWRDREILRESAVRQLIGSPISARTPLTAGVSAEMLPNQRTMGGGKNITRVGPGYYSFNWWLNTTNASGERLFVDAPPDTIIASGHGGKRALVLVPGLDLVAVWNDSRINDHDRSPGNPETQNNQALKWLISACRQP